MRYLRSKKGVLKEENYFRSETVLYHRYLGVFFKPNSEITSDLYKI
jgi:hypothetical protein